MTGQHAPTDRATRLTVIVVNHNGGALLGECVASIRAAALAAPATVALLIADNASTDGSAQAAATEADVELIELAANRGFATAANAAIAAGDTEWVALVNPDATLDPDALRAFFAIVDELPAAVGILAAQIRFAADRGRLNSAGIEVDELGVASERLIGRAASEASEPAAVFGASGGGAFLRRAMLEQIGAFDERYFLYFEDADLCWRAQAAGWRARYEPSIVIFHQHSAFTTQGSELKLYHVARNRVRTLAKNAPPALLRRNAPRILLHDALYVTYAALRLRSLAPLRGRVDGLREWRSFRPTTPPPDAPLAPAGSLAAALRRRRVSSRQSFAGRP